MLQPPLDVLKKKQKHMQMPASLAYVHFVHHTLQKAVEEKSPWDIQHWLSVGLAFGPCRRVSLFQMHGMLKLCILMNLFYHLLHLQGHFIEVVAGLMQFLPLCPQLLHFLCRFCCDGIWKLRLLADFQCMLNLSGWELLGGVVVKERNRRI